MSVNIKYLKYIILFVLLELLNIILIESSFILILTVAQILIVLYFIISGKLQSAMLWHLIFSVTAVDLNTLDYDAEMLSYPAIKLIGPLTINYIILGIIWLCCLKYPVKTPKYTVFYSFRKQFIILFLCGTLLGLFGIAISEATFSSFIPAFRYMLVAVLIIDTLSRLYDKHFIHICATISLCLLIASPIASTLSFFILNLTYTYSIVLASFNANCVFVVSPCLILCLLYKNLKALTPFIIFSIACLFLLIAAGGRGGHFLSLTVALLMIVYLVYFSKGNSNLSHVWLFKALIPIGIFGLISYSIVLLMNVGENLAANKLNELLSLFAVFDGSSGVALDNVATSPYIRISEVLDIIDNGFHNPICLMIGKGYGGYYTDSLGLFDHLNLFNAGAFSEADIQAGKFTTAHSMIPNVLLYHGIIGLIIIIKLAFQYFRQLSHSPLVFAAYSFFLFSLYYNVPLINACILFLFAAESSFKYKKSDSFHKHKTQTSNDIYKN